MLTENNLCRLQRDYGENFLSMTCSTYPRYTLDFGDFLERALVLTCPVAAELILFEKEPLKFELVEVPEKIHSNGGKIQINKVHTTQIGAKMMLEVQVAMISILQERTLSIDQRLIVLGFFLDKLREVYFGEFNFEIFYKMLGMYESKKFLSEQVPQMLRVFSFDSKKFIAQMMKFFESFYSDEKVVSKLRFINIVADVLEIKPDENHFVSIGKIAANYDKFADARKNFLGKYSTLLENFLVNELFMNCYPWRFDGDILKNYCVFMINYKIFELILF